MSRPLPLKSRRGLAFVQPRVSRQNIFFDDDERNLFLDILKRTVQRYGWLVHLWAQMTNHDHLLIETPQTNLSAGMCDLDRDYSETINQRHGRIGVCSRHPFASRVVLGTAS